MAQADDNPKMHPSAGTTKDPDDWVSGDDPMTGAQASYLKTLSEQAEQPDEYEDGASRRIDELKQKLGLE